MVFNRPVIYGTSYKGKLYVGKHIGNGKDYVGGGNFIKKILKSKNKKHLITGAIEYVNDVSLLNEKEIFWINKLKPNLNLAPGGEGGDRAMFFTKDILKSKSEKMKKIIRNKEWCKNISKSKIGKKLSEEHKNAIRLKHIGKKLSDEHKKKLCYSNSVKVRGEKYRQNMKKAITLWWQKRKVELNQCL